MFKGVKKYSAVFSFDQSDTKSGKRAKRTQRRSGQSCTRLAQDHAGVRKCPKVSDYVTWKHSKMENEPNGAL